MNRYSCGVVSHARVPVRNWKTPSLNFMALLLYLSWINLLPFSGSSFIFLTRTTYCIWPNVPKSAPLAAKTTESQYVISVFGGTASVFWSVHMWLNHPRCIFSATCEWCQCLSFGVHQASYHFLSCWQTHSGSQWYFGFTWAPFSGWLAVCACVCVC